MNLRKHTLLLLLSACPIFNLFGQFETREARVRIDSVFTRHDSLLARIKGGTGLGVEPGLFVKCFTAFKEIDGVEHSSREIGYGTILGSGPDDAICHLRLYENEAAGAGDHVSLNVSLPVPPFNSSLFVITLNAIDLTDFDKNPFFNGKELVRNVTAEQEEQIKQAMLKDMHATWEWAKDRSLPEPMVAPVKKGRYRGKRAIDVLRDATLRDLNSYLLYVKNYPAKYIGYEFRISESFMGWVVSNTPQSTEEVKLALLPVYKNKNELTKRLPEYRESILAEGQCSSWAQEAVELADKGRNNEADELVRFAAVIAELVKDTVGRVSALVSRAQILQDREKYREAISECVKAIATAGLIKDPRNPAHADCRKLELSAIIKKGFCEYSMSLYKEGLATLKGAEAAIGRYRDFLSPNDYFYYLQKTLEHSGWINHVSGDYGRAASEYARAIAINDSIGTYDAKNKNALYYRRLGNVFKDQGDYRQALRYYNDAMNIYSGLNDRKNELYTTADVGEAYYYLADYGKSRDYLEKAKTGLLHLNDSSNAGYASSFLGTVYYQEGKMDSAISAHHTAIALRKHSKSGRAWSWRQLGELYLLSGNKKQAWSAYDSSTFYYRQVPDSSGVADNYNSIGTALLNDENFKTAAGYFERAKGVNSKTSVEAYYNLFLAWNMIDSTRARRYLEECRRISAATNNGLYLFSALIELSKLAYRNNNFELADRYYDSVAHMAHAFGTGRAEASRLDLKAYSFIYRLEIDSAIRNYDRAVAIYDTVDQSAAVWERISLGDALVSKGEFKEAESCYLRGAEIAKSAAALVPLGASNNAVSFLYALLGEFEKGMIANQAADSVFRAGGNEFRLATAYVNRGTLFKTMGEYKKSIDAYLLADSIYREGRTEEMRSVVLNNIGVTYYNQADYNRAIDYFNRSARYFKRGLIDENYLLNKGNLAECLYYTGKKAEAEKVLLAAFPPAISKRFNRIASGMAIVLGNIYLDARQFSKARVYLDTAVAISFRSNEKPKMAEALISLARLHSAAGNDADAGKSLADAVAIVKSTYIPSISWIAWYESGLLAYRQGKIEEAIADFKAAVEIVEKNSNNVYGGDEARKIYRNDPRKVDLYGKLVVALAESGKAAEALAFADRSNMTGMKELLGSLSVKTGDSQKDAALEQAMALSQKKETLARKEADLKSQPQSEQVAAQLQSIVVEKEIAEKDFIRFTENLLRRYPDLKENFYDNVNPVDFENYKRKLPADLGVLLYVINDNKLLIFSLTNEKLGITPIELKTDLGRTVKEFSALLRLPSKATGTGAIRVRSTIADEEDNIDVSKLSFKEVSEKLYRQLVSPVAENIKNKTRLCIIPNGDLSNIPFQALGYPSGAAFRFLVEDYILFYTNRMKIFDEPESQSPVSSFAIFGVPDPTLKYTEKEASAIGEIMQAPDGVFVKSRATEEQAKQSLLQKKFVHFATHGILDYSDYNASYLKFLPSKDTSTGNNGKLTIDEIYELDIEGCDLVTLSACETAVAREKLKGWKISPANALLRKRVLSVIATLWKVDDEATSIVLEEFYRQLKAGKEKGESLRLAQEKLSRDGRYSHPYFWSAFVLYGDWR